MSLKIYKSSHSRVANNQCQFTETADLEPQSRLLFPLDLEAFLAMVVLGTMDLWPSNPPPTLIQDLNFFLIGETLFAKSSNLSTLARDVKDSDLPS